MVCPHCEARGVEVDMLFEDQTWTDAPIKGSLLRESQKVRKRPRRAYTCPNCLDEFVWEPSGLREKV